MGAALTLAKNNADVCVIDKSVFPRNKTCAGLVTGKTFDLIEGLFDGKSTDELFCCTADIVKLFKRTELLTESVLNKPVRLVNRRDFDAALVEEYKRRGGLILEGKKCAEVDYETNTVALSDGETLSYDYLLFADGALSMSHKSLKTDRRSLAFGIEAYIPSEGLDFNSINLYFGYLNSGYAWVFPHGKTVCVGVGGILNKSVDYRGILTGLIQDLGLNAGEVKYTGAFFPYGYAVPQDKLPDNIMLLGDAGGFADPISGEGLYMSIGSGIYAAQAIVSDDPKKTYLNSIKDYITVVKDGKKAQKAFFSGPTHKMLLNKMKGKNEFISFFFEKMVDEYIYGYRDGRKIYSDYKNKK